MLKSFIQPGGVAVTAIIREETINFLEAGRFVQIFAQETYSNTVLELPGST
jgi:hypothetical protein